VNDTDLAFADLTQLAAALDTGQITSTQLTTLYLDRLERYGPELGALARSTRTLALEQADTADRERRDGKRRGPLHGIPFGVKDLLATANIPTEWGSPAHAGQTFPEDAHVVERLREAGAVLIGKLSMVSLAGGGGYRYAAASATGPGRTPWNKDHWSGGSSSGPGAAVAAGLVGFAIGSETWGSIVCPSSFCGVTGLRPTFGRVSRHGAMALSWTMDKIGPMARSARDCALILQAIAGRDDRDPTTSSASRFSPGRRRSVRGLKLGIVRPDYGKEDGTHRPQPETDAAFEAALTALRSLGVQLQDATLPDLDADAAAGTIISVEGSAAFETVIRDKARLSSLPDDAQQGGLLAGLVIPGVDYVRSLRIRALAQAAVADLFTQYDALVAPGMLQVASPVSMSLDDYFVGSDKGLSGLGNLTGLPALCVRMGCGTGALPLGLQFVGAPWDEAMVLNLGEAYQKVTDWHRKRPPGFAD
jgi:aspartyl-tRNA(Asn)/glutamyl-tRNA(Gln) amidotransferase subunit A